MLTYGEAFYKLRQDLQVWYDPQESAAIAHEVLYHITNLSKIDRLMLKDQMLTALQQNDFDYMADELLQGKPLQYVTGTAYFMEQTFVVNESVLIPRPETEELVFWILNDYAEKPQPEILDIGTGSGCIAISLQQRMPEARVSACDISTNALATAHLNATQKELPVRFLELDILDEQARDTLASYDVIVSNPPYIPRREALEMHENVKAFEPDNALFVPDEDPLLFYRNIAAFGLKHLKPGAAVYCELHRDLSAETALLFEQMGYRYVEPRKDMHDNWRMLKAML